MRSGSVCSLILSVILLGCTANTTDPVPQEGTLSFALSGAIEGHFTSSGPPPSGASALPSADGESLMLFGGRTRGSVQDALTIEIRFPSQPGTFSAELTSSLSWGMSTRFSGEGEFFAITSGEVTVSHIGRGRIRGSFSAQAQRFVFDSTLESQEIVIADGEFDLPIVSMRH